MEITILCALVLSEAVSAYGNNVPKDYEKRFDACRDVAETATQWGLDPILLVSMAYEETSMVADAVSDKGAMGVIQVMPHHHCPGRTSKDCDLTAAAMHAVKKVAHVWGCGEDYRQRADRARNSSRTEFVTYARDVGLCPEPDWSEVLCHYNAGNQCTRRSRLYAKMILRRRERLKRQLLVVTPPADSHLIDPREPQ